MKILLACLVLMSVKSALACGGARPSPYPFSGDQAVLQNAQASVFTCTVDGAEVLGRIGVYAVYRCMGSPTYIGLSVGGKTMIVKSLEATGVDSFKALAHPSGSSFNIDGELSCHVQPIPKPL